MFARSKIPLRLFLILGVFILAISLGGCKKATSSLEQSTSPAQEKGEYQLVTAKEFVQKPAGEDFTVKVKILSNFGKSEDGKYQFYEVSDETGKMIVGFAMSNQDKWSAIIGAEVGGIYQLQGEKQQHFNGWRKVEAGVIYMSEEWLFIDAEKSGAIARASEVSKSAGPKGPELMSIANAWDMPFEEKIIIVEGRPYIDSGYYPSPPWGGSDAGYAYILKDATGEIMVIVTQDKKMRMGEKYQVYGQLVSCASGRCLLVNSTDIAGTKREMVDTPFEQNGIKPVKNVKVCGYGGSGRQTIQANVLAKLEPKDFTLGMSKGENYYLVEDETGAVIVTTAQTMEVRKDYQISGYLEEMAPEEITLFNEWLNKGRIGPVAHPPSYEIKVNYSAECVMAVIDEQDEAGKPSVQEVSERIKW